MLCISSGSRPILETSVVCKARKELCYVRFLQLHVGLAGYGPDYFETAHIVEKKSWTTPPERRHGIHTNVSLVSCVRHVMRKTEAHFFQPFHTDMGTDILALQVRECAKVGGQTCVSPVRAIYNDLMENHPLVVHALARPDWPVRRYVP